MKQTERQTPISRRDFVKLATVFGTGLLLPRISEQNWPLDSILGREPLQQPLVIEQSEGTLPEEINGFSTEVNYYPVTEVNHEELPAYEIGEMVASFHVTNTRNKYETTINASIGTGTKTGEQTKNRLHDTFFTHDQNNMYFRQADFETLIAIPIAAMFENLNVNNGYPFNISINVGSATNENYLGETRTIKKGNCIPTRPNDQVIIVNSSKIKNIYNYDSTSSDRISLDDAVFSTPAHEAIHYYIRMMGFTSDKQQRLISEEPFAEAFSHMAVKAVEPLWKSGTISDPDSFFNKRINQMADYYFQYHTLYMSGEWENDEPKYAGYEHYLEVEKAMRDKNMNWKDFFAKMSHYYAVCTTNGTSPSPFQFIFDDVVNTNLNYLGEVLQNPHSGHNDDIFDILRQKLNQNVVASHVGYEQYLEGSSFQTVTIRKEELLVPGKFPILNGPESVYGLVKDRFDRIRVLRSGEQIAFDPSQDLLMTVYNYTDLFSAFTYSVEMRDVPSLPQKNYTPIIQIS
jgi:hypothetical protein